MKNKKIASYIIKCVTVAVCILIWIAIWQLVASVINKTAFFSGVPETLSALFVLLGKGAFWKTVFQSILRIIIGFVIGVFVGTVLAFICNYCPPINTFISLGMSVIKATPVASVIMIIWIFIGSASVPSVIALLMVAPIIWQNLTDGYKALSKELEEATRVFEFSRIKKFKHLVFPTLLHYFIPALLTSVSLAWKSGIAAEIIAGTRNSIGYYIKSNKSTFDSDYMLAWTLVVIIISLVFENLIKFLMRRFKANEPHS